MWEGAGMCSFGVCDSWPEQSLNPNYNRLQGIVNKFQYKERLASCSEIIVHTLGFWSFAEPFATRGSTRWGPNSWPSKRPPFIAGVPDASGTFSGAGSSTIQFSFARECTKWLTDLNVSTVDHWSTMLFTGCPSPWKRQPSCGGGG